MAVAFVAVAATAVAVKIGRDMRRYKTDPDYLLAMAIGGNKTIKDSDIISDRDDVRIIQTGAAEKAAAKIAMQTWKLVMREIEDARIAARKELKKEMTELVAQKKSLREKAKMVRRPMKSCKRLYRKHLSVLRKIEKVRASIDIIM